MATPPPNQTPIEALLRQDRTNLRAAAAEFPSLESWVASCGEDGAMAWLKGNGTMEQAIAFAELFWPQISELDGRLYLGLQPPTDTLKDWATRSPETSPALVQSLLNRRSPAALLALGGGVAAEVAMAQLLSQMWAARIAARWPGRAVTFATGQNDDGVWLSFWEE